MYRVDTVWFLIVLVSDMLKILKAKVEAHFLKKHLLLKSTNVWHKMFSENVQGQQKAFQNTQQYRN